MSAEDTVQPSFYSVWPNTGKKFSQQLGEIRTDTSSLTPIARAAGFDAAGDWSDLDGIAANSVQAFEYGKDGFHNKFRHHYNKDDNLLEIASNTGTENVPNWYTMWSIDSDGQVTQQNTPTTASNLGSGSGWFKQKSGVDLQFKSVTVTSPITLTAGANSIDIDGSDLVSTYSSDVAASPSGDANTGIEIILSEDGKTGNDLPFKGIKAGPNIVVRKALSNTAIEIESTAQVVEFYGIRVSHSDGGTSYPEVHHFIVNREDFYVTQETTNPSNKTVILNSISDPFNSSDYVAVIGDDMTGQLAMHNGTAAEPAIGFTLDNTMGLYRNAANDLGVAIAGAAHTRFLSDRVFLAKDLQITADGSAASPDVYWFPDSDTGLFQQGLDSIAFSTGGIRAGYFSKDQDFYVTGRVFAGSGDDPVHPDYGFDKSPGVGMYDDDANLLSFATDGARAGYFDASQNFHCTNNIFSGAVINAGTYVNATEYVKANTYVDATLYIKAGTLFTAPDGSQLAPSYTFTSNNDTGIYTTGSSNIDFTNDNSRSFVIGTGSIVSLRQYQSWIGGAENAGSASAPDFSFLGETNTGMYKSAAGFLEFTVLGTRRMYLDQYSNVFSGGTFLGANASKTQPTYRFTNDQDTGIYLKADGQIGLSCADTEEAYLAADGLHVTNDVFVATEVYGVGWDSDLSVPTKDAVYDKIETLVSAVDAASRFYGVIFKDSRANGTVMRDDTLVVDFDHFYVAGRPDGKPLLSMKENQTFEDSLTIGAGADTDSTIEFWDAGALAWTLGRDESADDFKLAKGAFGDATDYLRVSTGEFDFRGHELKAGRVEAGPSTFYAQVKFEGGNISNLLIGADDGDNHTDTPQIAFASEPTSGFGYNESSGYPMITKAGSVRMFFPASYIGCSDEIRVQGPGTSTDPSVNFTTDPDTGIYQLTSGNDGTIAFSSQTNRVGYWDADGLNVDNDLNVTNDLKAGRVEAGLGSFYTSLAVDGNLTMTAAPDDVRGSGQILLQRSTTAPSIADASDIDSGIGFTATAIMFRYGNANICAINSNGLINYKQLQLDTSNQAAACVLNFSQDTDTGIYQKVSADNSLLFRTGNTNVGGWNEDGELGLTVWNDVKSGRVEAGIGQFYGQVGFYDKAPIAQQTGVAVDAASIHAALVNLGLITA